MKNLSKENKVNLLKKKSICIFLTLLVVLSFSTFFLTGCGTSDESFSVYASFGLSQITVIKSGKNFDARYNNAKLQISEFIKEVDDALGTEKEGSDIKRFNDGERDFSLSKHTVEVFNLSKRIYRETAEKFNPAIYPLAKLWGFYPNSISNRVPQISEIQECLLNINFDNVNINNGKFESESSFSMLDFGGISKGYMANVIKDIMTNYELNGIVNLAGNVYCVGSKNENDFKVGVKLPRIENNANSYLCVINVRNLSVVTSGDYERFFINDGNRYCHVINGETGFPVHFDGIGESIDNSDKVISVTLVGEDSAVLDAYATAIMVAGFNDCEALFDELNISGIVVNANKEYKIINNLEVTNVNPSYVKK